MRVGIREQLALLVLLASLICLAVISIATWVNNYNFVVDIKSQGLSLTASLKAAQVSADLELIQSTIATIVTRVLIQSALQRFYLGNQTDANWVRATTDVQSALASGGYASLLQAVIYPRNQTGNQKGLVNVTGVFPQPIALPYDYPNGTVVNLGDEGPGYPPMLYPNITYIPTTQVDPTDPEVNITDVLAFKDFPLNLTSVLFLGPFQVNDTFALVSLTLPIINNTSNVDILGYMTVIADASTLYNILNSREGLGNTGIVLLVGPQNMENRFVYDDRPVTPTNSAGPGIGAAKVDFVFAPTPLPGQTNRHDKYNGSFHLSGYPTALKGLTEPNSAINNASSDLSTKNEQGVNVAVGWARPRSNIVDWLVIVEQTHTEAFAPVVQLRNILLACVFGTFGLIALLVVPTAHFSVLPIRRLRDATEKSVQPPGYTPTNSVQSDGMDDPGLASGEGEEVADEEVARSPSSQHSNKKRGTMIWLKDFRRGSKRKSKAERSEDARRRVFKIPGKVQDRKHFITDELTELTGTFNEMSDELMLQYVKLEQRVEERTRELEISKKAAEAANESKTMFIANISHELKTPLNGILGMCAVCMGEDDLPRIKKSLQVVYKSGDLLLHLLNDLLTFTKNQIGQSLSLEEKEFGLSDIKSQIVTIFDKQVREGHINFGVNFISSESNEFSPEREKPTIESLPALGPQGTGRLKNMRLWGDQHRILQVIINLVSNSLKFTPEGGKVEVRIKCLGEIDKWSDKSGSRKDSIGSKPNSHRASGSRNSRHRHRVGSGSNTSLGSRGISSQGGKQMGTALLINPMDPRAAQTHLQIQDRSSTPPPTNARTLMFEFLVEDSGPGIPEHLQQRVFEPFEQGDLGLSRKYGGTGLGLSICSQLATLMGGSISLESTEGVGSTFNMRIPLKFVKERTSSTTSSEQHGSRPQSITGAEDLRSGKLSGVDGTTGGGSTPMGFEKDPQPRLVGLSAPFFASTPLSGPAATNDHMDALDRVAAARSGNSKVRVLVAEDNLVNQEVVLRMLKLEDIYDVTIAKDGQEAYEMVKASMDEGTMYNLIFMDIQMPNLDGLQSTRLIREMGYSAPIVALTAFAEESNVQECMDSGMDMFLSKPIRRPALKQVLKKFATIPEESEEASLTRKNTLEDIPSPKTSDEIDPYKPGPSTANGDAEHPTSNHT